MSSSTHTVCCHGQAPARVLLNGCRCYSMLIPHQGVCPLFPACLTKCTHPCHMSLSARRNTHCLTDKGMRAKRPPYDAIQQLGACACINVCLFGVDGGVVSSPCLLGGLRERGEWEHVLWRTVLESACVFVRSVRPQLLALAQAAQTDPPCPRLRHPTESLSVRLSISPPFSAESLLSLLQE